LGADEPAPFEVVNPDSRGELLLICDHASNRVPARLDNLEVTGQHLASHIGWDPGAAAVARKLTAQLDAALVLSNYSRLVIDCNRWPDTADSIPATSGGITIPGNAALSAEDALDRRRTLFDPYQAEIAGRLIDARPHCALLSIHSFTPSLVGNHRPWSIGVCYRNDQMLARHWRAALQARIEEKFTDRDSVTVGDNEPYAIEAGCDYTIPVQGESRGISSIMLEIRQDRIQDCAGVQLWSDIISKAWLSIRSL
jgi:predicted N-formylglutamate amidohydrolase